MANKHKAPIVWPEGHFTIDDIHNKIVPDMVMITLRFRVKRALEDKVIQTIGRIKPPIGRPKLVFAKSPATQEVIDAPRAAGVLPPNDDTVKVKVVDVKPSVEEPVSINVGEDVKATATVKS